MSCGPVLVSGHHQQTPASNRDHVSVVKNFYILGWGLHGEFKEHPSALGIIPIYKNVISEINLNTYF